MPLVRIDVPAGRPAEYRRAVADTAYEAMLTELKVPEHDRFDVVAEHRPDGLIIDPSYLGIARSAEALIVQITLSEGRSVEVKQASVTEGLTARVGLRPEDAMINLLEVKKKNWSFGNGVAQYV